MYYLELSSRGFKLQEEIGLSDIPTVSIGKSYQVLLKRKRALVVNDDGKKFFVAYRGWDKKYQ